MADRSTDEIRAELRATELAEQLVAAKADPDHDPDDLAELKADLRSARHEFRSLREARGAGPGSAQPATVETTADTTKPGN